MENVKYYRVNPDTPTKLFGLWSLVDHVRPNQAILLNPTSLSLGTKSLVLHSRPIFSSPFVPVEEVRKLQHSTSTCAYICTYHHLHVVGWFVRNQR